MSPLVSIVVPSYNHGLFIQECIQSIIDQDYQNIELIIIDDGSSDDSIQKIEEMAEACQNRFVRFEFRHRPNKGLCATLNEALEWCEGEFFSPSASDDVLASSKTSSQVNTFLHKKGLTGVFTGINIINEKGLYIKTKGKNACFSFNEVLLRNHLMPGQALMLKTEKIRSVKGYDEEMKIEDLDLLLRLAEQGAIFCSINKPLVYYRKHNNNLSGNHKLMLKSVKEILGKYKKHPKYKHALSNSIMIEAHGALALNGKLSRSYMFEAIKVFPLNIFSKSMLKFLIKIIIKKK